MRLRRTIFMSLAVLLIAVPSARAQGGDAGALSTLNTGPLAVSGEKGKDEVETKFTILNSSAESIHINRVRLQAATSDGLEVGTWDPEDIPPEEAVRLAVTITGVKGLDEEVAGQLVVNSKELPVAQALTITPTAPDEPWPVVLVFLSLAIAALTAVGVWKAVDAPLKDMAPDPKWSFSSWATTLTAAGAAFGVVLGGVTYPSFPHHVSKVELTNLNILFGLLLVVGPFLFEAIRRYVPATPAGAVRSPLAAKEDDDKPKREGRKWMLLLASTFTFWAVLGQIGALGLLGTELVDGFWEWVCAIAAIVFAGFAWKYFRDTLNEQLETDWEKEAEKAEGDECCQPHSWSLL